MKGKKKWGEEKRKRCESLKNITREAPFGGGFKAAAGGIENLFSPLLRGHIPPQTPPGYPPPLFVNSFIRPAIQTQKEDPEKKTSG